MKAGPDNLIEKYTPMLYPPMLSICLIASLRKHLSCENNTEEVFGPGLICMEVSKA